MVWQKGNLLEAFHGSKLCMNNVHDLTSVYRIAYHAGIIIAKARPNIPQTMVDSSDRAYC